jgi:hypothetical protein
MLKGCVKRRLPRPYTFVTTLAAAMLAAGGAAADDVAVTEGTADRAQEEPDGARFRGAIAAEGGAMIVPGGGAVGVVGLTGQIGGQINHLVGVYWVPYADVIFGDVGGFNPGSAVLVDFTIDDTVSIGVGPEVGAFLGAFAGPSSVGGALAATYGGRIHAGFYPLQDRGEDGIRRKALALGVDVRLLAADIGTVAVSASGSEASVATTFMVVPTVTLGYQAF